MRRRGLIEAICDKCGHTRLCKSDHALELLGWRRVELLDDYKSPFTGDLCANCFEEMSD